MFSRRWIINYGLIVLICLFTYIGSRFDVETGVQTQPSITGLKLADIESLEIQTADESLKLIRNGSEWSIESPFRWPANNTSVERMLDIANAKTESQLSVDEIDLATIGLQSPRAVMRLNEATILFGATNNIGARRYTMIGSTVYLLPDIYLSLISQGVTGVVDRRLLPRSLQLKSLRLPDFEISRSIDKTWQVTNSERFDRDQFTQLVENWQGLEASRVKAFNSSATPRQKFQVQLENGQSHEFFLMSIDPEIIIAHPQIGLQYHFNDDHYYQLISLRDDENPS